MSDNVNLSKPYPLAHSASFCSAKIFQTVLHEYKNKQLGAGDMQKDRQADALVGLAQAHPNNAHTCF